MCMRECVFGSSLASLFPFPACWAPRVPWPVHGDAGALGASLGLFSELSSCMSEKMDQATEVAKPPTCPGPGELLFHLFFLFFSVKQPPQTSSSFPPPLYPAEPQC